MTGRFAPRATRLPHPDEFADFDAASSPRRQPPKFRQLLEAFGTLAVLLLLGGALLVAMVGFAASSPEDAIRRTWVAVGHPQLREIRFPDDQTITATLRNGVSRT